MHINHQQLLRNILSENPPLWFPDLYSKYSELAGPVAITESGVRKHLEQLMKMKLVVKGDVFTRRKGYTYSVPENNASPVAMPDEIIYGNQVVDATTFLSTLWVTNKHPLISDANWEQHRLKLMTYLVGGISPEELHIWLENYRDSLARHLSQINTLINGDLLMKPKQEAIRRSIPNNETLLDILNQYVNGQIENLPEV